MVSGGIVSSFRGAGYQLIFQRAYANSLLLLVLGIVFLPFTTLAYAWMTNAEGGVRSTFAIVVMVVAVLADVSSFEGGRRSRRG